jgi:hypothetical protein
MKCSFRLIPNELNGGDSCLLNYQGSDEPKNVFGKKCTIRVFEIDSQAEGKKNDLLAEFSTVIVKAPLPDRGQFDSAQTTRTDSFDNALPGPEYKNDPKGNLLPIPLKYTPAHFKLNLFGCKEQTYVILIKGDKSEVDECVFEIGFSIHIEGNEVFNSFKGHATLDCCNILSENCANAATFFKANHEELLITRHVGTHFGDHFPYFLQQTGQEDFTSDPNFRQSAFDKFKQDRIDYSLQITSCIDFVKSAMELGFLKTGMENDWKRIWSTVKNGRGDLLAKGLVESGWFAYYYNPDVHHPADDGPQGTQDYKDASEHTFSYTNVISAKTYYGIPIHGYIVNYHPTSTSMIPGFRKVSQFYRQPKTATPEVKIINSILKRTFGFVLARGGSHTAMFSNGNILELHWDVGPRHSSGHPLFDVTDLIRKWPWNSGIIIFPPKGIK